MAAMNEKDYYAILGVEQDATTDEIRKAFQKKARTLHPDVNKEEGAEEKFKEVSEAYAVLSDEQKRKRYDAMRSGNPFADAGSYGYPAGTYGSGAGYSGDPFGWGYPFGGYEAQQTTSRSYNPKTGADILFEVTLDDKAAAEGVHRGVSYQRYATCDKCHGNGSLTHAEPITCPTCGGTGHMTVDLSSIFGFGAIEVTCPECEGTGKVVEDPCDGCGGSGRVLSASEAVIDIPAGSHDGDTVVVKGMGNAGTNGKPSGDFVCRVQLPSERLTTNQSLGMSIVGFSLPFIVMGIVNPDVRSLAVTGILLVVFGLYQLIRDGLRANAHWWRHAALALGAGLLRSLFILALVLALHGLISLQLRSPIVGLLLPLFFVYIILGRRIR